MVTFAIDTMAGWIWNLILYMAGDPVLAGIIGFVMLIMVGIRMGLGADGLIVLGVFTATLMGRLFLPIDLGILFIIGITLSVIVMAILRMMRH